MADAVQYEEPVADHEWNAVPGVSSDLLQWLPVVVRRQFDRRCQRRRFPAGQAIFYHGDVGTAMYRVLSGTVRMSTMRADGHETVYALLGPGECIGSSSLIDGDILPHTVEALTEVEAQVLNLTAFREMRAEYREFDDALLRLMANRMKMFSLYVAHTMDPDLPARVALRLIEVARIGADGGLAASVTQAAFSPLIGISRQTVNKILKQFEAQGLVRLRYGSIELRDLDALNRRAGNAC